MNQYIFTDSQFSRDQSVKFHWFSFREKIWKSKDEDEKVDVIVLVVEEETETLFVHKFNEFRWKLSTRKEARCR